METFWERLRELNIERNTKHFPHCNVWESWQWASCIMGEIGEVFDELKKSWRDDKRESFLWKELADIVIYVDLFCWHLEISPLTGWVENEYSITDYPWSVDRAVISTLSGYSHSLATESVCATRVLRRYVTLESLVAFIRDLAAARVGCSLETVVAEKFNEVSRRVGFEKDLIPF